MDWGHGFWLTRMLFQRALGVLYLVAFICALNQFRPLLGERGLTPVVDFVRVVPFWRSPSLFYLAPKDWAFSAGAWLGIILSCLALTGLADAGSPWLSVSVWSSLWLLYLSFVNVGQTFYAFGWESILLEAGFYAIFLGPRGLAPPKVVIWLLRWLLFRVMFGAGLIKLRGDPCWRNLTCLDYYFQSQPMPNPLSWAFHWAPEWTHRAGVLFNHCAELAAPFFYFAPARLCAAAGAVTVVFQGFIMLSGNLSWLNLLTIVLAIPCFDDARLAALLRLSPGAAGPTPAAFSACAWAVAALTAWLSVNPVLNMLSAGQIMNTSYNPLHLVGTYGAFGSITRRRYEIVVEGTQDDALSPTTRWREYAFKGKPGDPAHFPPQIAPYHLRLDWLMWFAAMAPDYFSYGEPWFARFVGKLLVADPGTLSLLAGDPFGGKPPTFVRAELYEYRFSTPQQRRATGLWWQRRLVGEYLPAASRTPTGQLLLHAGASQ